MYSFIAAIWLWSVRCYDSVFWYFFVMYGVMYSFIAAIWLWPVRCCESVFNVQFFVLSWEFLFCRRHAAEHLLVYIYLSGEKCKMRDTYFDLIPEKFLPMAKCLRWLFLASRGNRVLSSISKPMKYRSTCLSENRSITIMTNLRHQNRYHTSWLI